MANSKTTSSTSSLLSDLSKPISLPFKAMGYLMPVMTYRESRSEGSGVATSLAKAVGTELMYNAPILGEVMFAKDILEGVYGVAGEVGRNNAHVSGGMYHARTGGHFSDSRQAATLRQKGLTAMSNTNNNMRSVLGNEARSYHRSNFG